MLTPSFSDRPGPTYRSAFFVGVLATFVAAGCGGETGIVLEVTRADSVPAEVDALRFFVGMAVDPDRPTALMDDRDPESEVAFASARDLLADPYRLLLRPGDGAAEMSMVVAVVAFADGQVVGFGTLQDQVSFVDGKVLQWNVVLTGEAGGRVDITDTGCLKWSNDTGTIIIAPPDDQDCDNDHADVDCNELDPGVGPTKQERCGNQIDDDCDTLVDEVEDLDQDGFDNCVDCQDSNENVFPGAAELCDGLDNDCNGFCDDGPLDRDGDFYNTCGSKIFDDGTCSDPHPDTVDCDDDNEHVNPGAEEVCDGVDNNCDEACDDGHDPDGDGYTFCGSKVTACFGATKPEYVDCDPDDETVHPGAEERCDGVDNDCDGIFYPATAPCYAEGDATGSCFVGVRQCDDANGGDWASACETNSDQPAPASLCEAYDACDQADAADPYECANMGVSTGSFACDLFFTGEGLCPNRVVALPNTATGQCLWSILGGPEQTAYQVSLRSLETATNTGGVLAECEAGFAVVAPRTAPPQPDSVYVWQKIDNTDSQVVGLQLAPEPVAECPTQGLQCAGLSAVPPP